jgi:Protein of unknown function (DUF3631)
VSEWKTDFPDADSGAPTPEPVRPLAESLDGLVAFVRRFVILDEAQVTAVALWIAHAWAIVAAHVTAYLYVTSAEPESGKTRLLEVAHELVPKPLSTMNISDAALFRAIASVHPTLFLDEADSIFNQRTQKTGVNDEKRSLINAGYRRGQRVYRMGGSNRTQLESFEVFGAKAIAGLGSLPGTLASRCVRIELKRRRRDEPVEDFIPIDFQDETASLRAELEAWADSAVSSLRTMPSSKVEGLRDRQNEVWRPMLAIATLAGPSWAARARRAAFALAAGDASDEPSLGLLLLSDAHEVFHPTRNNGEPLDPVDAMATVDLITLLARIEESPWAEWWIDPKTDAPNRKGPRNLAKLLRPHGIRVRPVRIDDRVVKGYRCEDFIDAWDRFLPSSRPAGLAVTSVTPEAQSQADVTDVTAATATRDGPDWDALGGRDRFCEACTTPELCARDHDCRELRRLAAQLTVAEERQKGETP